MEGHSHSHSHSHSSPRTKGGVPGSGCCAPKEEDIPLTHVHVGDTLRVRPGEKVPVDGVVVGS